MDKINDMYGRYAVVMPLQARTALEGAGKLIGSLTGCSGNTLPTDGTDANVIAPEGSKMCYTLGGGSYTVTLLGDMREDQRSTLVELPNGKRTMVSNEWLSELSPTCGRDQMPTEEE